MIGEARSFVFISCNSFEKKNQYAWNFLLTNMKKMRMYVAWWVLWRFELVKRRSVVRPNIDRMHIWPYKTDNCHYKAVGKPRGVKLNEQEASIRRQRVVRVTRSAWIFINNRRQHWPLSSLQSYERWLHDTAVEPDHLNLLTHEIVLEELTYRKVLSRRRKKCLRTVINAWTFPFSFWNKVAKWLSAQ